MQIKNEQPSNFTNILIIGLILVSVYLLYSLTLAFYKSHQIDVYIANFEDENKRIEAENKKLIEEFDYVTSEAYIDKILKQDKGLINPGEEIIVIASNSAATENKESVFDLDKFGQKDLSKLTNLQKWKIFIFDENPLR
ncbi:septum formation initiator family protein [Candidatus Peregrinibacteria bacterium]|nr:septum formation initiator family protein [Candidatus Peregrinibacteria bacterium]